MGLGPYIRKDILIRRYPYRPTKKVTGPEYYILISQVSLCKGSLYPGLTVLELLHTIYILRLSTSPLANRRYVLIFGNRS